jgi:aspartyl-tRNA(Asn)/glutamyl-tRNA(Gln) amidotransferase subunit B
VFARKNYFYPDLPKGYQISQYELPIVQRRQLEIVLDDGTQDASASRARISKKTPASRCTRMPGLTGIDLNRAGTPLIEIVSEPDMRSAKEAVAYMKKLHHARALPRDLRRQHAGRLVPLRRQRLRAPEGPGEVRHAREIKNLNSFRFVEKAINHEVARQIE